MRVHAKAHACKKLKTRVSFTRGHQVNVELYRIYNIYVYRISKENRLLGGLWYGNSKPDMSLFFKPIADALTRLYLEGTYGHFNYVM